MLGLTVGRVEYICNDCRNTIPSGTQSLGLGYGYRGGSNGRYCIDCIIETGKVLEMRKYEEKLMEV